MLTLSIKAQTNYYHYKEKHINLTIDTSAVGVLTKDTNAANQLLSQLKYLKRTSFSPVFDYGNQSYYCKITLDENTKPQKDSLFTILENNLTISKEISCNKTSSGKRVGLTNRFYVQLASDCDVPTFYAYAEQKNVDVIGEMSFLEGWYVISCPFESNQNAIELSNQFYESGLFESTEPEFIYQNLLTSSDTYYSDQWGINNVGQYGGLTGADINVIPAWTITKGQNVKVAVFDHGIEMTHPDLVSNIYNYGYDAEHGVSPSTLRGKHGTACAGIIGASENNIGIIGVAPQSEIIPISLNFKEFNTSEQIARGFEWARLNGADIISNSWGGYDTCFIIETAINRALTEGRGGKGCVIVFASGNENDTNIRYPGRYNPDILVVGAINQCGERKKPLSCDGENWGSCYGRHLDVMAPGVLISTTDLLSIRGYNNQLPAHIRQGGNILSSDYSDQDYTVWFDGTSAAAPFVSGVAALVLSANQNLTNKQVNYLIESTARKIKSDKYNYMQDNYHHSGTWNDSMGYGLVDAFAAVKIASLNYNLYTRDNLSDNGSEPLIDPLDGIADSPDLWLRNYPDCGTTHQQMVNGTNYLYVTLHNHSTATDTSWTADSIRIFAKPTFLNWHNWGGSSWTELCAAPLPRIAPCTDTTICIPVSNQGLFALNTNYALYSRIESPFDQLAATETTSVGRNVEDNNNISLKNVYITNNQIVPNEYGLSANVNISSYPSAVASSKLKFIFYDGTTNILDEAEVTLVFPEDLTIDWSPSSDNLKQITANTYLVTGETVEISGVPETDVTLRYNFLTRKNQPEVIYKNHVIQYIGGGEDEEIVGGLTIQIEKPERAETDRFHANAGNDTAVLVGTSATLHAAQINENATYRWYDKERNFKYQGLNYTVTPSETDEYILEVTARSDGYRDLDTVKVNVVPCCIRSITPNPVTDNWVTVSYEYAATVSTAQLLIYNSGTATLVGNYDLSNLDNVGGVDIEVTGYPTGSYTVVLVCDNAVCHSKVLIRQ